MTKGRTLKKTMAYEKIMCAKKQKYKTTWIQGTTNIYIYIFFSWRIKCAGE